MKIDKMYAKPLVLAADQQGSTVIRDQDGVPIAWRLAKAGDNHLTIKGQPLTLSLSAEDIAGIVAYHQNKQEKIPLDSRHFLYHLASRHGVDENAVVNLLPSGTGTFGFGSLQQRDNDLWLADVEYVPLARKLMRDGIFRYFSPVFRGIVTPPLRVTSVALENEPAINALDQLAAADQPMPVNFNIAALANNLDELAAAAESSANNPQEMSMKTKLLTALAGLLGMDDIALGADNNIPDDIITKIEATADKLSSLSNFAAEIRNSLALAADADADTVTAALKGLQAKGDGYDQLKQRVDELALAAENAKRDDLIKQGLTAGKLTQAMVDGWVNAADKPVDSIALAAFLAKAPVVVPLDQIERDKLPDADTVALTAEDRAACDALGISEEDFLAAKKQENARP